VLAVKKGFSLVEMLLALLFGSLLLVMVISLYATTVSSGAKSLKYARLRADLQSIISVMETDIRRAGYGGSEYMVGSGAVKTVDSIHSEDKECIVYYYNHDGSTSVRDSNKMGFRFNLDKNEIQFGTGVDPLAANCYNSGYWQALSDKAFLKITALRFTENISPSASAAMRSVQIDLKGELVSDKQITHSISTMVQVRNVELN
jgi:prepilin peptidase dependent protein B